MWLFPGILLYILDSGAGGELNKSAWARNREERERKEREEKEREQKKAGEMMKGSINDSYHSNITPSTAFQIRNRYLSRVGTKVREKRQFSCKFSVFLFVFVCFYRCQTMFTLLEIL